jgi:hypothetical protein
LGLASCRSTKITEPVYSKAPKVQVLIDSVEASHFEFDWFSGKIAGKYKDDAQSFSFKGTIKIKKDSLIWMSISPGLGLELGRVLLDQDSLRFMNRFDKTYFTSSYSDLSKKTQSPLSFSRIQALLLGNSMSEFEERKYYSEIENQAFTISSVSEKQLKKISRSRRKPDETYFTATVDPYTYRITSQGLSNLKLNRSLTIFYEDFEIHNTHNFAESIDFRILANASLSLNLAYSKINLTKKLKFPFKVPKSYEVIY